MKLKTLLLSFFSLFLIGQANAQCSANFTSSQQPNGSVIFTCTGSNSIFTTYNWSFGNGSTGTGNPATAYYNAPGTYYVCLYVYDNASTCMDSSCVPITVTGGTSCNANFTTNTTNNILSLNATGVNSSNATYTWLVNNTQIATTPSATYTFTNGNYDVCLIVTDAANNCSDTVCQNLNLTISTSCTAAFTYVCYPTSAALTATGNYSPSTVFTWKSNGTVISNMQNYLYNAGVGTYTICLYILDTFSNCTDSVCQTVTIGNTLPCQANYYIYPDTNGAPHTYIGVNASTGSNLTYTWTWGDGSSSTGPYPSHTYASAGSYVICLYISSNASSCSDSICLTQGILKGTAMYSVNFQAPAATPLVEKTVLEVYPNPVHHQVSIKGKDGQYLQVQLFNLNGALQQSLRIQSNQNIDMSGYSQGVYIMKVVDEDGATSMLKVIKE